MNKITITIKQYHSRILAIENKQLKLYKKSISMTIDKMDECILMIVDDKVLIDENKYKELRKLCLTEDFVNNYQKYFPNIKFIATLHQDKNGDATILGLRPQMAKNTEKYNEKIDDSVVMKI